MSQPTLQKHISRLMALLLCALLLLPYIPVAHAEEGSCGDSLTWSFDGSILTISGTGEMDDYSESDPAPWSAYRDAILSLSLPDGLTKIGSYAFADCRALRAVTIPGSVEIIEDAAFLRCTGLTMVSFNEGLQIIGVCAFEQCTTLADVRLPNSLLHLKDHAFYMCESLSYATVPSAVQTIGSGVFAYCSGLVRADINAAVTMPSWSFYGCSNLQIVTVRGASVPPESLMVTNEPEGIPDYSAQPSMPYEKTEMETVPEPSTPAEKTVEGTASGESVITDSSGETVIEKNTVTQNENSLVTTITQTSGEDSNTTNTQISSTVQNENGWQDVIDQINSALLNQGEEPVEVTVMTPNSNTVSKEVLQELSGKNVTVNIQTQSGTSFILEGNQLEKDKIKKDLQLSYTISIAENVPEMMAGCVVYALKFDTSVSFDMEIVMRLPGNHAFQTASLYQLKRWKDPQLLQTVLVDDAGNVHWYVSSVDHKTEYLIGINIPGANVTEAIIPENLYDEYHLVDHSTGKQYVITGRKSSWNMGLGKVMAILAVVMVSAIGVIGFVMYFWNKQRLKNGYVPQWEDDEET